MSAKEKFFLDKGMIATVVSAFFLNFLIWIRGSGIYDAINCIMTLFLVGAIFFMLTFFLNYQVKLYKKLNNAMSLWIAMSLTTFFSIEILNILICMAKGFTYYDPLFASNFWQNRLINFIVGGVANLLAQWIWSREALHLFK